MSTSPKPSPRLSKSTFLRGLQCPKSLWLYKHAYELQDATSPALEAVFSRGHEIGRLAWGLFPGGVDLSPEYVDGVPMFEGPLARTREELRGEAPVLYEPAFEHDGVFAAVDMMVRDGAFARRSSSLSPSFSSARSSFSELAWSSSIQSG